jgi:hypothetical protein
VDGVFIDLEASFVDGDVVVGPAECDQVVRVGHSYRHPRVDVVDFNPVGAVAPVDSTVSSGPPLEAIR